MKAAKENGFWRLMASIMIVCEYTLLHSHNDAARALGAFIAVLIVYAILTAIHEGEQP